MPQDWNASLPITNNIFNRLLLSEAFGRGGREYKERKKKRIQRKKEKENGANQEDGIYVTFLEYVNDNKLFNLWRPFVNHSCCNYYYE